MAGPGLLGGIVEQRLSGEFALGLGTRLGEGELAEAGAHAIVAAGSVSGDAGGITYARNGAAAITVANHDGFVSHRNVLREKADFIGRGAQRALGAIGDCAYQAGAIALAGLCAAN